MDFLRPPPQLGWCKWCLVIQADQKCAKCDSNFCDHCLKIHECGVDTSESEEE